MHGNFDSDLFSAYFDDEATLAERAEAERQLNASPAARDFLDEWSLIADDLRSLPKAQLPKDFTSHVLAAAEREMLIPTDSSAEPVNSEVARTPQSKKSPWMARGLTLAATAAALLLSIKLLGPSVDTEPDPSESSIAKVPVDRTTRNLVGTIEAGHNSLARNGIATGPEAAKADGSGLREGFLRQRGVYEEPLIPAVKLSEGFQSAASNESGLVLVDDLRNLTELDVGRVVTAVEKTESGVAVVRLTVVDYDQGLDALQLLLSRNAIQLHPNEEFDKSKLAANMAKTTNKSASQKLVAIYVKSTSDRLTTALAELKNDSQFRSLEAGESLAAAEFDDGTQRQLALLDQTDASFRARDGIERLKTSSSFFKKHPQRSVTATVRNQPQPTQDGKKNTTAFKPSGGNVNNPPGAMRPENPTRSRTLSQPTVATEKQRTIAELSRISRQLQLTVPESLLRRNATQMLAGRNQRTQSMRFAIGGQNSGSASPATRPSAKPIRVLFVVVCSPEAESGQPADNVPE